MPAPQIADLSALDAALGAPRFLLLKHSERCGISRAAMQALEAFLDAHPEVPAGWIEVREQRALSERITTTTGITHASPQAIWIEDGQPAWHENHFEINSRSLARTLARS